MIISNTNPPRITLEVSVKDFKGEPKTNLSSAIVRVYTTNLGTETNILNPINLTQVGSSNVWRYVWEPTSLSPAHYVAEYTLVDTEGMTTKATEDIEVGYLESKIDAIATNVELIKQVQIGRWKITSDNQMILYKEDNTTEIARFNLFDIDGTPSHLDVADRRKI